MKFRGIVLLLTAIAIVGCSGDKPDPAKDKALEDAFHKKPDINTLSPGMRKWVEQKMAESQSGKPSTNSKPPTAGQ